MTTEQLVRRGLHTLADAVDTIAPPLDEIIVHPSNVTALRPPRRTRRRLINAGVATAVVIAGGATAAATGNLPDSIASRFGLTDEFEPGMRASVDDATLHRTFIDPAGSVYEWWTAPTDGGGGCMTLVKAVGDTNADFVSCGNQAPGTIITAFVNVGGWNLGDQTAFYGSTPDDAADVTIRLTTGFTFTAPVTDNEFFVVLDLPCTTEQPCEIESATARDTGGQPITVP